MHVYVLSHLSLVWLYVTLNYHTIALISHTSKLMLKILQARLQQYVNHELPDVQGRGTRDQLPTSAGSWKKHENSRKTSISALLTMPKPLTVDHNKLWKIVKEMGISDHWPASWETYMQVRKQQLELDMEQQTGSKQEKEYVKAAYCHPAYLTSMQSTSWETLGWKKHKLESRLPGEISITSDMQMTPPL